MMSSTFPAGSQLEAEAYPTILEKLVVFFLDWTPEVGVEIPQKILAPWLEVVSEETLESSLFKTMNPELRKSFRGLSQVNETPKLGVMNDSEI